MTNISGDKVSAKAKDTIDLINHYLWQPIKIAMMIIEKMISNTLKRATPIVMMNRAVLNGFGQVNAAIMKANRIAGIETAARDAIAIISLPNPPLSRFTPRKPK